MSASYRPGDRSGDHPSARLSARLGDRTRERIRWHCRRGMLELDLVLSAFLERHLERLDAAGREAFTGLLERTDPELLDLVMGHAEALDARERAVLELMREISCIDRTLSTV